MSSVNELRSWVDRAVIATLPEIVLGFGSIAQADVVVGRVVPAVPQVREDGVATAGRARRRGSRCRGQ